MSLTSDILVELWNRELNYKGVRVNIFGIPRFKKYSKRTLRTTVDRLARNALIEKELTGLVLSPAGKKYIVKKNNSLKQFERPRNSSLKKDVLLMFDVPVARKAEREWLRWHLKKFGYVMLQHSVWVGPSPLPKDFITYLKEIKLANSIRILKLSKPLGI